MVESAKVDLAMHNTYKLKIYTYTQYTPKRYLYIKSYICYTHAPLYMKSMETHRFQFIVTLSQDIYCYKIPIYFNLLYT